MKKASPSLLLLLALLLLSSAALLAAGQQQQQPQTGKQTAANNPRLQKAYEALQALKRAITEDPKNLTRNWCGPDVCAYYGVFCAPAPDDPHAVTVAGLDLNHGDLAGTFPEELGLLSDLALLHLNSNRFAGGLPESLPKLHLLHELDVSNNRLSGGFPQHILCLPNVKYVDIRFNNLCGPVPPAIFDKPLDALFLNDNHFDFELPESLGNSPASVIVLANLRLSGCLPPSVGRMAGTLNEFVVLNAGLRSCIPQEVGWLRELTVLDLSFNQLQGQLPESMAGMHALEQLDVAHNELSGHIPEGICALAPNLRNFTYSYNYFCSEPQRCLDIRRIDDRQNCIAGRPDQRPADQCLAFLHRPPVHCDEHGCFAPPHY
ncbi:leucine-rich repeat extensin-like protein 6 [Phragmites australis]|uniref:leucine-rich repeat extensin-like protein 6 n=1 Tax=Phragmites australis TaxID=29695 RepID=UPI002D788516|nr:leucine-rich repeat extensin-like protein 6 [Phragmites australis]